MPGTDGRCHLPFAFLLGHSNLIHFNVHVAYRNRRYTAPASGHTFPATAHFTNAILEQKLKYTTGGMWGARTVIEIDSEAMARIYKAVITSER